MTLEDLEPIAAIEAQAFSEPYRFSMLRQLYEIHGSEWFVADLDVSVVGYSLTMEKAGQALLFTFGVAKDFRHRGYGRVLLEHTMRQYRALGVRISLTVDPENARAVNLYKQAGFVHMRRDPKYFGLDEPRDIYEYPG
ncbi:GNAT family N-acetyltransferase [Nocardia sp. NPDC051570]|uniref:GNAT family N-acetyltransferase n=1 Tax=Nocardia sp. NPDC051570 TaxID=3364324 RepID=UPI0037B6853E